MLVTSSKRVKYVFLAYIKKDGKELYFTSVPKCCEYELDNIIGGTYIKGEGWFTESEIKGYNIVG